MNEQADAFFAQYGPPSRQDWRQTTAGSAFIGLLVTIIAFLVYCGSVDPETSPYEQLTRLLAFTIRMISRLSGTIFRLQGSNMSGREGSALKTVFGLDSGSLRNISPTGTALRGLGSLLKSTTSEVPPGLGNMSNSCYQNSIIQGLASLCSLPDFLKVSNMGNKVSSSSTTCALLETIDKLNNPTNNGRHFWLPDKLKSMSTWQQQDAQEYFSKILDQLDREAVQSLEISNRVNLGLRDISAAAGLVVDRSRVLSSVDSLRNPLEGMLAQRVGCTQCGYSEGLSLIPFNCLTVPLGNDHIYDVRDCLDEYTKLEQIEGVECPKCTLLRAQKQLRQIAEREAPVSLLNSVHDRLRFVEDALQDDDFSDNTILKRCQVPKKQWTSSTKSKQAVIARPPKSLAIHVNRSLFNEFTGAQTKNNAHVQFPLRLDLASWCLGNRSGNDNVFTEDWSMNPTESMLPEEDEELSACEFELRAVVTHSGRHENGHYICYRKRPRPESRHGLEDVENEALSKDTEAWWRLSDEDVHVAGEENVMRQGGVFMLFYERVEANPIQLHSLATADIATEDRHSHIATATTVDASEAAQVPLPDEYEDLDDFLVQFEPITTAQLIPYQTRPHSTAASIPLLAEDKDVDEVPAPTAHQSDSVLVAKVSEAVPSPRWVLDKENEGLLTQEELVNPADLGSRQESEAETTASTGIPPIGSIDNSDADDSSTTSLHDNATDSDDATRNLYKDPILTKCIQMRTSGLSSNTEPENPLQSPVFRMVTAT